MGYQPEKGPSWFWHQNFGASFLRRFICCLLPVAEDFSVLFGIFLQLLALFHSVGDGDICLLNYLNVLYALIFNSVLMS